jgi:hypothetical protein
MEKELANDNQQNVVIAKSRYNGTHHSRNAFSWMFPVRCRSELHLVVGLVYADNRY